MHARVTTLQVDASRIDDAVRELEEESIPSLEQNEGFKGFTLMADRQGGRMVGVSFWESEDAMRQAEQAGEEARRRAVETGGASGEPQVDRFEVVIDTMA